MDVNLKSEIESALSEDHLHLIRMIADVAATFGYPIYLVGGSVRDLLLGRSINDFDLTVEGDAGAFAESMLRKLGGKILIHAKFGTARWTPTESTFESFKVPILHPEDFPPFLDFVTARNETYDHPGALPTIKKSTIFDDLRRRDFTINAMAIRLDGHHFGELIDPLNGQKDIEDKLIRILHRQSFIDDPTRMFRAFRYAMRYGFELAPETREALNDNEARNVLSQLSGERIRHEFDLIFEEDRPLLPLAALDDVPGFMKAIHPALGNGSATALSHLKNPPIDFGKFVTPEILSFRQTLGWVLYLMHLSVADIDSVAERLAFPAMLTKSVQGASSLSKNIKSFKDWKPSQWTFHLDELPSLSIYAVWLVSSENSLREYLVKWQNVKAITTGDNLKQLGLEPGPKYKEILDRLRAAWLNGDVKTQEEEFKLRDHLITN